MSKTPMHQLSEIGQSIWLDYISRSLIETGKLKSLIDQGLRGMTSNPSIFNQAIGSSQDYDEKIIQLKKKNLSSFEIYDELTIQDIQDATDIFKPVYDQTNGLDGYVSLEINPLLANKIDEQIKEGLRLFKKVDRPNLMIKVPSTNEGFPVIEELISQGINVNTTLIFSLKQYELTAKAYLKGLKRLSNRKSDISSVRSVASVFVSRIDTAIDKLLDEKISQEKRESNRIQMKYLKGKAAVANSRIIFERFNEIFNDLEFKQLQAKKANVQRVLWGSTGTKNPQYSDIKYVTELIANPTVNTIPESTLNAFLDHGKAKNAFDNNPQESLDVLKSLKNFGIDTDKICLELLKDGCEAFNKAFQSLLKTIEKKTEQLTVS